jgi:hypothetical protein
MRRLPGPADRPLCEGVKTPEAPVELFRGWQRTQTQSSVRALRSLRQQMDVWFCLEQEPKAERHCCVTADPDQTNCAPSGARPGILCFSLDFDLHRGGRSGMYGPPPFCKRKMRMTELVCANVFGLNWGKPNIAVTRGNLAKKCRRPPSEWRVSVVVCS